MTTKSDLCIKCGDCCKFFIVEIRQPDLPQEVKDWREWLEARGIKIVREHSRWWRIKVPHQCPHLKIVDKEALIVVPGHEKESFHYCEVYPNRPLVCKRFDGRLEPERDGLKCLWKTEKFE